MFYKRGGTAIKAELHCAHCDAETIHELVYVGRLLASSTCTVCKTQVRHESDDLRIEYIKDLENRIKTKPFRLWRRFWRSPTDTVRTFPSKSMSQPKKFWSEIKNLFSR